ncbi:MAG: DUF3298 and DUF4163 domain-containing protein [Muribaculaceae bacterium]|nr:DUF3298 and DUF4163 domain-containing protein [Muribaculaceae bacterium]
MNKKLSLLACAPVALMAITSCGKTTAEQANNDANDVVTYNVNQQIKKISKVYYCPADTMFGADIKVYSQKKADVQFITDMNGTVPSALQDTVISRAFGAKGVTVDVAMNNFATSAAEYLETPAADRVEVKGMPTDSNMVMLYEDVNVTVTDLSEKVVVCEVNFDSFTGGAHGNTSSQFINYDVKNGKVLNFDDIFVPGSDAELFKIVKEQLMTKYNVTSMDELAKVSGIFVDDLYLSKNVYFTDNGIAFYYNPYDIGPWSIGAVVVNAYEMQLTPYLTPAAKACFAE